MVAVDEPNIAPDVVVEILSPGDRAADVEDKMRVHLAAGSRVVFLVDPATQSVTVCDGARRQKLERNSTLTHRALPGFRLAVKSLFKLSRPL
jgi:Uma2 family endonuclease